MCRLFILTGSPIEVKIQGITVDSDLVPRISGVLSNIFNGCIEFKSIVQINDLFVFKSEYPHDNKNDLDSQNKKMVHNSITERQFELLKPQIKIEVEDITGLNLNHIEFLPGMFGSHFLILTFEPTPATQLFAIHH